MTRKSNIFQYRSFLVFSAFLFLFTIIFPVSAKAVEYVKVETGWSFTANLDQQVFNGDKTKISSIIATDGQVVSIFKYSYTKDGNVREYIQSPDYYSQSSETKICPAHIDLVTGVNYSTKLVTPLEPSAGKGCDSLGKNDWVTKPISVTATSLPSVVEAASLINWGNEPLGCEDFDDIPVGIPPTERSAMNYNCPGGGSIQNGSFKAEAITPTEQDPLSEETGTDCADAGFVLGWIICPIGSAMAEVTQFVDDQLYGLLYINTSDWDDSGVKEAWSNIRTIASALIVLVALVGVASQIFSFDFISAYTIRKILPKLFIAVILIQLSYVLCILAINISNTVGLSTQALISAPFESIANGAVSAKADGWIGFSDVLTVFSENAQSANTAGIVVAGGGIVAGLFSLGTITALAAGGAAAMGGVMIYLLALLIPALIAVLLAFVVIILRVILLIGLLVVVPLALVAWILPNTSKWFDRWWAIFFSLLAFFPIIIAFLTFGKVGALLIGTSAGDSTTRNIVILTGVIIAYFLPYFLIFKLIKFSSGALGKIQGALNSVENKAKETGPIKSFREQGLKSGAVAKRARDRTNANINTEGLQGAALARARLRQVRGRSGLGTLGATGRYGRKVREDERIEAYKEGIVEANEVSRLGGRDYDQQRAARAAIVRANVGDSVTIGNSRVAVTRELQNAIATVQAEQKEFSELESFYRDDPGLPTAERNRRTENLRQLQQFATNNPEAFGSFDGRAPGISRGTAGGRITGTSGADGWAPAIKNFATISPSDRADIAAIINAEIASGDTARVNQAMATLTQIARGQTGGDVTAAGDLVALGRATGLDLSRIRNDTNASITIDPTTGRPIIR